MCLCTAFSTVDQDADGLISWNELTSYAIDCGLRSTAATSVSAITMGAGNTSGGSGSSSLLGTGSSVSAAHRELSDHYVAAPVMSPAKSATVEKVCTYQTHSDHFLIFTMTSTVIIPSPLSHLFPLFSFLSFSFQSPNLSHLDLCHSNP